MRSISSWTSPNPLSGYPTQALSKHPERWCFLPPSFRRCVSAWNSNYYVFFFPFQTDWSSYPYLRLYWIWANWVTRTTFRISPSNNSGTSSEARMAWVRISPGPHPILPAAFPRRRYSTLRNNEVSFPLYFEKGPRDGSKDLIWVPFPLSYPELLFPPSLSLPPSASNHPTVRAQNQSRGKWWRKNARRSH